MYLEHNDSLIDLKGIDQITRNHALMSNNNDDGKAPIQEMKPYITILYKSGTTQIHEFKTEEEMLKIWDSIRNLLNKGRWG